MRWFLSPIVSLLFLSDLAQAQAPWRLSLSAAHHHHSRGLNAWSAWLNLSLPLGTARGGLAREDSVRPKAVEFRVSSFFARRVVRQSLRAGGFLGHTSRLRSLRARSRTSAILPDLDFSAARTTEESLRLAPTLQDPYRYTQAGGTQLTLKARASWRLQRFIFAQEELQVERLRQRWAAARRARIRRVIKVLFQWQRAWITASDEEVSERQRWVATLDALEKEAELDVLTGGWFARYAPSRRPRLPGRKKKLEEASEAE